MAMDRSELADPFMYFMIPPPRMTQHVNFGALQGHGAPWLSIPAREQHALWWFTPQPQQRHIVRLAGCNQIGSAIRRCETGVEFSTVATLCLIKPARIDARRNGMCSDAVLRGEDVRLERFRNGVDQGS